MSLQRIKKILTTHFVSYKTLFRVFVLLVLIYVVYYKVLPQTSIYRSDNWWHWSMKKGYSKSAIYWAKCVIRNAAKDDTAVYAYLAAAYELNEQYDKALECYAISYPRCSGWLEVQLAVPRIEYKRNRNKDAFLGYCQYADDCLKNDRVDLNDQRLVVRSMQLGRIRYLITMEQSSPPYMRLSPFLEYRDFLDFMEEEYQKLGEPPEYAAAMELFRAIDTEIDEKHLPRSGASDQLDAMREQILKERRANKVTE